MSDRQQTSFDRDEIDALRAALLGGALGGGGLWAHILWRHRAGGLAALPPAGTTWPDT